jgi:hypothetical protein
MRVALTVAIAAVAFAVTPSAQESPLFRGPNKPAVERRADIDAFRALLARREIDRGGRCALPDGTTRGVNTTVTFPHGQIYRCSANWVPISGRGSSPVRQVFERRVTWVNEPARFRLDASALNAIGTVSR